MTDLDLQALDVLQHASYERTPSGLVRLRISTPLANAVIYVQGAHLAHYRPAGAAPVLFLSERSALVPSKAIRGGVPVIFPWFGPRAGEPGAPMHGFARTCGWAVEDLSQTPDGTVKVTFLLESNERTREAWPHDFVLRHHLTIGAQLDIALEVQNTSPEPFMYEEALHTYFAVGDVREVAITGLEGAEYLDKTNRFSLERQCVEPMRLTRETDRVYLHSQSACAIDDPTLRRRIVMEKSGSDTTVVWNPWSERAAALADLGEDAWQRMLCIESANAAANMVTLPPGATHILGTTVRIEPLPSAH